MREQLRSYLDLGFVEQARDGPRENEAFVEPPSPLESTGAGPPAGPHERVERFPAPAPKASRPPGGLSRAALWLLGGLLLVVLLALTFLAFFPPPAASTGATSKTVHRKMAREASPRPPLTHSAPSRLPSAVPEVGGLAGGLGAGPPPTPVPAPVPPKPGSVAVLVGILIGATVALGVLSALVHFLKKRKNPLYWQLACWLLVVVGIATRPVAVASSGLPTAGQLLISIAVGLAVLPGLMRWLNRVSSRPGLEHVAVPFSLGFLLDLSQVLAMSFGVKLPWIPS